MNGSEGGFEGGERKREAREGELNAARGVLAGGGGAAAASAPARAAAEIESWPEPLPTSRPALAPMFAEVTPAPRPDSRLVTWREWEGDEAEAFRSLAVRLARRRAEAAGGEAAVEATFGAASGGTPGAGAGRRGCRVLCLSADGGEGRTTLAANLATALARQSRRPTLLLEADALRPSLTELWQIGERAGLGDWWEAARPQGEGATAGSAGMGSEFSRRSDPAALANYVDHLRGSDLHLLSAGGRRVDPFDFAASTRAENAMEQLSEWFEWMIVDGPPLLGGAGGAAWARWADGLVLVARSGKARRGRWRRAMELVERRPIWAVVLNGARGEG